MFACGSFGFIAKTKKKTFEKIMRKASVKTVDTQCLSQNSWYPTRTNLKHDVQQKLVNVSIDYLGLSV